MLSYFARHMVTASLTRTAPGSYVEGAWVPGASLPATSIWIIAPQPVRANEMRNIEEGQNVSDYVKTYVHTSVNIMPRGSAAEADMITVDGSTYIVFQVDRRGFEGRFHRVIMRNTRGL